MLHHRVGDTSHEIVLRGAPASRPDHDEIGPLVAGEFDQFGARRSDQYDAFRRVSCRLQGACDSGRQFLGFAPEHSLNLIAHRHGPCGNAEAFQREGRDHTGHRYNRTNLLV